MKTYILRRTKPVEPQKSLPPARPKPVVPEASKGAKRKNADRAGAYGDVWTFIALDADSKLIPSFIVGKRDAYHAKAFISDLAGRLQKRVQVSSDSLASYADAMERGFGTEVDYGQISKTYAFTNVTANAAIRYSPAEVVKVEKTVVSGMPDISRISTSTLKSRIIRFVCIAAG
jgi:hypothetical protein